MRRVLACASAVAAVVVASGCSSSSGQDSSADSQTIVVATSASPAAPATSSAPVKSSAAAVPSSAGPSCDLSKEPDVYVWYKAPGMQDTAQELGGWNPETCKSSVDEIMTGSATGPGYCTAIGWKSANPGYDPDATPAKPLKHVIEEIGGSC